MRESVVRIPHSSSRGLMADSVRWRLGSAGGFGVCFEAGEVMSL